MMRKPGFFALPAELGPPAIHRRRGRFEVLRLWSGHASLPSSRPQRSQDPESVPVFHAYTLDK